MMNRFFFSKRFFPLFTTQFMNAFSDSMFKNALIILITYKIAATSSFSAGTLVSLAAGVFIVPYFLFSATAGLLADKYDRAKLVRYYKLIEIFTMSLGVVAFIMHSTWFLFVILFALGVQSTFFGPIKYSVLPQHLKGNELIAGNSYIEAGTFVSILIGTLTGGLVIMMNNGVIIAGVVLMLVAIAGYISSCYIPTAPGGSPDLVIRKNIILDTYDTVKLTLENKKLLLYIILISWFWLEGAVFLAQISIYCKEILHTDETTVTTFLTIFSVGIAVGSVACGKLSKGKVNLKFISSGALGMGFFTLLLGLYSFHIMKYIDFNANLMTVFQFSKSFSHLMLFIILFGITFFAGLYTVPLYTLMQMESKKENISRVVATGNIIGSLFMVGSSALSIAFFSMGFSILAVFVFLGTLNILLGIVLIKYKYW